MRNNLSLLALPLLLVLPAACGAPADATPKAKAAATAWLELTDGGQYGESWEGAATVFKKAVTKAGWENAISHVRGPLGALKSRALKNATYTRTLPGAPDGEYVVLQFDTSFENKAAAVETLVPMREPDGAWKVSGYYIK